MLTIEDYPIQIKDFKVTLLAANIDKVVVFHDNQTDEYDGYEFKFSEDLDSKHIQSIQIINTHEYELIINIYCYKEEK